MESRYWFLTVLFLNSIIFDRWKMKCVVYIYNFSLQGLKWRLSIAVLQIMAVAVISVATGPVAPSALVTMVTRCRLTARHVKVGNENIALVKYAAIYISTVKL